MRTLMIFLALPHCVDAQESIHLVGPDGSAKEDLQKAANSVLKRCEAYGYSGLRADLVDRAGKPSVRIGSDDGITAKMLPKIVLFGTVPAQQPRVQWRYTLSEPEKDQFAPGKKAPKGARWLDLHEVLRHGRELPDAQRYVLIREEPSLLPTEWGALQASKEGGGEYYPVTADATRRLYWERETRKADCVLVLDNALFSGASLQFGDTSEAKAKLRFFASTPDNDARVLDCILKYPLSLRLQLDK